MRSSVVSISLLALSMASLHASCLPDRCKDPSANLELTVSFSGFNLASARRVEFETEVNAPASVSGLSHGILERRVGSIAYPSGLSGQVTYRVHTGSYLGSLEVASHSFRVFVRVFGQKDGQADALLAEGYKRWDGLRASGCYLDQSMKVTSTPTCAHKLEGDPCVSPSQGWQPRGVCISSAGELKCLPSRCGDGFTDRRGGEICDPGDGDTPLEPCTSDCLARPREVQVRVAAAGGVTPAGAVAPGSVTGSVGDLTLSPGIWSLDATGVGDLQGSLLVADVDGDGADELLLGLPGGIYDPATGDDPSPCDSQVVGVVYGYDWPMMAGYTYGGSTRSHVTINGPCGAKSTRGASFGAALAAGDLDGDGALDLVVGAPRADGLDGKAAGGSVVVLFGGTTGALPVRPEAVIHVEDVSLPARSYLGTEGFFSNNLPGDFLGYAVAVADFDLDGYADLAVAAPQRKSSSVGRRGAVFLIRGGPDFRERATSAVEVGTMASFQIQGGNARDGVRLGVSLATGDVDGDGYPDLIMGTTSADSGRQYDEHEGGVTVLFGHAKVFERHGTSAVVNVFDEDPIEESDVFSLDVIGLGGDPGSGLRAALRGLGGTVAAADLDGDGRAEVIATLGRAPLGDAPGMVAVLGGAYFARLRASLPSELPPSASELTLIQGPEGADFGLTLGAVDVSGDRRLDLLIGAPGETFFPTSGEPDPVPQAGAVYALLSTHLGQWFAPQGATDPLVVDLVALREAGSPTDEAPPFGLIWLRGTLENGRFGTAMAGSSHLAQSDYDMEYRNAYTYIFEPGHPTTGGLPAAGRVWSFFLPGLLPCDSKALCEILKTGD